jgi:hypothetical protein
MPEFQMSRLSVFVYVVGQNQVHQDSTDDQRGNLGDRMRWLGGRPPTSMMSS